MILGEINGNYLSNITLAAAPSTEQVLAAVAYATDNSLLFEWCLKNKIALKFYGRLDDTVAVAPPVLRLFLNSASRAVECRLVQHHHAKVIWWRGHGLYIGSANLTGSAWYKNIEAGCYFDENEISDEMANDILAMFDKLHAESTPLTAELVSEMERRNKELTNAEPDASGFWSSPSFNRWPGLLTTSPRAASDARKAAFLREWHSTLQELREIGTLVSRDGNRPSWVSRDAPVGTQADQFLHAHYYQHTMDGNRANYPTHYERNKSRRREALRDSVKWWSQLTSAPQFEDRMLNETAPRLRELLSPEGLSIMSEQSFFEICSGIHSIRDYARRVPNKVVELPDDGTRYSISRKTASLAKFIWRNRSSNGSRIDQVLRYVLYDGSDALVPERLWDAIASPKWKIDGIGVSALGEIAGWARPDLFPPRNGRTSKALRSLGYDVTIHVG